MQSLITQNAMDAIIPLILQMLGLILVTFIDPYIKRNNRIIILINFALIITIIIQNVIDSNSEIPFIRTLSSIYGYSVRPLILLLFCLIIKSERNQTPFWILIGINTIINMTSLFTDICFGISNDNHFYRGPLAYSSHICSAIMIVYMIYLTLSAKTDKRRFQVIIPIFNTAVVVFAVLLDTFIVQTEGVISLLSIAMVISCPFYYIWLHLQFVHEHEKAFMAEQRIRIIMSQIQPHFLYNTLSSIQALCRIDPEQAFNVTEKFGTYLRQNIDTLDKPQLIPFKNELEHTQVYCEIEMIRFPTVSVKYDTRDTDFLVPALTVQPLMENAIRHGVRIREKGLVTVSTRKIEGYHEIVIHDNGKGFDVNQKHSPDEKHIGIHNVRERIEKMCGGTLTIDSIIGEGTTVTILIPVKKDRKKK
ncbi:MAG: histidine kinase [Clostridiales bacterium]|nr:histidine kinase [Clostridiales bacterium]